MKRALFAVGYFLLAGIVSGVGLTGIARDAAGNPLTINGRIWFELSQSGNTIGGCGGYGSSFQVGPGQPITFRLTAGAIVAGATLIPNDCISPANTYYRQTIVTSSGAIAARRNVVVVASPDPQDIGTLATPSLPGSGTGTGGTVFQVNAGAGLTGGPITGTGTLALAIPVAVSSGGTGATGQTTARLNLGAAQSGANSDITGLSGIGAGSVGAPTLGFSLGAKGFYAISTNDAAAASSSVEYFRWGPDTRASIPTTHFYQPVWIERDLGAQAVTGPDVLRVAAKVQSGADAGIYTGLNVTNNTAAGTDVDHNGYFHAIQSNVGVGIPSPNEAAAGLFFIFGYNTGSIFGLDVQPHQTKAAAGFAPNLVGANIRVHNDQKTGTNTTATYGVFLSSDSNGRPSNAAAVGLHSQRDTSQDYTTGTVTVTNASTTVTGSGTAWTSVGVSPFVNLAGKSIQLPNGVYGIASVGGATSITLSTPYTGSTLAGQAYRIRVAEPWTTEVSLANVGGEAIVIGQDANFPPANTSSAFRVLNPAGNDNLTRIDFSGSLRTKEASRVAPWIEPQVAYAGAQLTMTTSRQDLATVTFTPASDSRCTITGVFDVEATAVSAGSVFVGELLIGGAAQTQQAILEETASGGRQTTSQTWTPTLTGGASVTIKTTGKLNSAGATYRVNPTHTTLSMTCVGRA